MLERVGRAVHGSQARHGCAHEHDAARFWPQRSVALVAQVLHDQVHLGLVVVVEARVEHCIVLLQDISDERISIVSTELMQSTSGRLKPPKNAFTCACYKKHNMITNKNLIGIKHRTDPLDG